MKVALTTSNQFGDRGPKPGETGEALYFRYIEDELWLCVLFYGRPGTYWVKPDQVESLVS